ncbi:hypothetical protein SAMN05216315_11619 [Nitrosospira sp. Nsp18]|jgi:hypothetical protein|uniref:hypothetical protein n=1 Tax=Nitrosospira sp. Nsp18 TaxID=1855334 RepID=UPI00088EE1AC|nr:hypothetical protein [Nitrosospira sp. Nsp18]SDA21334.1 hypothetical protein SAMN05216315_11619 [Nitrosospira sp. Nsp18]
MKSIESCNLTPQGMKERSSKVSLTPPVSFFAVPTIMPLTGQGMVGAGGKRP